MKPCLFILSLLASTSLQAQDTSLVKDKADHLGTSQISVVKDARVDSLIKKQIEINEFTSRDARRIVQGYRILVMNTQDRQEALQAKSVVYNQLPELTPYLVYQAPYYKVKIGNFTQTEEAESLLPVVKQLFPKGVFVVKDLVEINPNKAHSVTLP